MCSTPLVRSPPGSTVRRPAVVGWLVAVALLVTGAQGQSDLDRLASDAAARYAEGDKAGAVALYRQLADRAATDAERVEALMNVAWLEHLSGRDNAAINALTEALSIDPDQRFQPDLYTDAFGALFDRGLERARLQREIDLTHEIDQALALRASGDLAGARAALVRARTMDPEAPAVLLNLALLDLDQGDEEAALLAFERVLTLAARPESRLETSHKAYALAKVGYLYNRRGQFEEAARHLEEAVSLSPDDHSSWTNLGVARQQLGRNETARDAFSRAVDLRPDDANAVANLALAQIALGDARGAAGLLERAHQRWPNDPALQLHRARALRTLGDPAAALEAFERVLLLDSDNRHGHAAPAAALAARLHHDRGHADQALKRATEATTWDPSLVDAWIVQGLAYRALGQAAEAIDRFGKALQRDPTRADVHLQLGSLHYQLRAFEQAESAFRRALEIDPSSRAARDNLAAVRARQPLQPVASTGATADVDTASAADSAAVRRTERPALGLVYADYDYSNVDLEGVMIADVEPDSPAARADLRKDDLILKIDGRPMASASDLDRYLYTETRAIQFTVDLLRQNRPLRLILRLE